MNVLLPRDTVSDDACRLVEIHVEKGQLVKAGDRLFTFESSKSVFDVSAEIAGVIDWDMLTIHEFYPVGEPIAKIVLHESTGAVRATESEIPSTTQKRIGQIRSHLVEGRIANGHVLPSATQALNFVRAHDLQAEFSIPMEPERSVNQVDGDPDVVNAQLNMNALRRQMQQRFRRHVPTGTLLNDRWDLARQWNFGAGTSCYDECLILGHVEVGENCWIGPFTILDGAHAKLTIGDRSSIGAGTHVYTHDTIARTLVGEQAETHMAPTTIGRNCFIAPNVVIGPGTRLGDRSFVGVGAYVQGIFPPDSYIVGNPAVRAGDIEFTDDGYRIRKLSNHIT